MNIVSSKVGSWGTQIADLIFPPFCLSCGLPGDWFCDLCSARAEPSPLSWCGSCDRLALADRTLCDRCGRNAGLRRLVSAYRYEGSIEALIRAVKFRPAIIGFANISRLPQLGLRLKTIRPQPTVFIPIPVSASRLATRGFNQAEELALRLGPLLPQARIQTQLIRTRAALPQVGQSAVARQTNVDGLFTWKGAALAGQHCLLIDDVWTTGATMGDAARALRAAGARSVTGLTLAQTPPAALKA